MILVDDLSLAGAAPAASVSIERLNPCHGRFGDGRVGRRWAGL